MKRLSLIIPMFKVEKYVERCLRSLEQQDIPQDDYEIICINDGSPDNSSGIVKSLQAEFFNINLIDQENQGVSRARNKGIESATGKYVLFIDPDDYVDANSFAKLLKVAEDKNAQVTFLGFTVLEEDGSIRHHCFNELAGDRIYTGTEAYYVSRGDGSTDPDRMWAILFETQFLNTNNLRYLPDVPYLEDGEFVARILCLSERCFFYGRSFYQRTTRPGSATNSKLFHSIPAMNGFVNAAINLRNFRNQVFLSTPQKEFINQPILKFVILSITATASLRRFKTFLTVALTLKKHGINILELNGCHKHYQYLGRLYNLTPFLLYSYLVLRAAVLFICNLRPEVLNRNGAKE